MKLLITIDTECDNAWARGAEISTANARFLPRFQGLCERFGYKPTYLVSYEMARDRFFVDFAKGVLKSSTGEVGSHPHAWNSPPAYSLTSDDMRYHPYMFEYPQEIIKQKVKVLTDLLEDTFSLKMYSHRAGRWGLNASYARILADCNYKLDCSVTPHRKWDPTPRPTGDPPCPVLDFRGFPTEPYFLDAQDISRPGDLPILEVPVTLLAGHGRLLSAIYSLFSEGRVRRGIRFLFGRPVKWFRPHPVHKEMMKVVTKKVSQDADYIMFMLHSSELMPGGSPNFKNTTQIDRMYAEVSQAFQYLADNGAQGATCYEYYQYFTSQMKR